MYWDGLECTAIQQIFYVFIFSFFFPEDSDRGSLCSLTFVVWIDNSWIFYVALMKESLLFTLALWKMTTNLKRVTCTALLEQDWGLPCFCSLLSARLSTCKLYQCEPQWRDPRTLQFCCLHVYVGKQELFQILRANYLKRRERFIVMLSLLAMMSYAVIFQI